MNTSKLIAALAVSFVASGAALAAGGEATYELPQPTSSTLTRAAVQAEALQARAAGIVVAGETGQTLAPAFQAQKSRAAVRAEVLETAARAEMRALHGESNAFEIVAGATAQRTLMAAR